MNRRLDFCRHTLSAECNLVLQESSWRITWYGSATKLGITRPDRILLPNASEYHHHNSSVNLTSYFRWVRNSKSYAKFCVCFVEFLSSIGESFVTLIIPLKGFRGWATTRNCRVERRLCRKHCSCKRNSICRACECTRRRSLLSSRDDCTE